MASERVKRLLCATEPRGSAEAIEHLLEATELHDAQALVLIGDLQDGAQAIDGYRTVFRALGGLGLPTFWVPGPGDAPIQDYLREAHAIETVFPLLHGVHGTAAFAPGYVLVAGFGGEVYDDPEADREELERLRYPRWEPEYRLKLLRELQEHDLVLLFATRPRHKGKGSGGSDAVAELVGTLRPRLVVCGGERGIELLGRTTVVAPGRLTDGHCAVVDLRARDARLEQFGATPVNR